MKANKQTNKLMQRINEEKTKCAEMLGFEEKLAKKLSKRMDDLSALNKGNFTEDKVNDLKLYVKAKKAEREMYFNQRTLRLNERDRIVQDALIRLSNKQFSVSVKQFSVSVIALKQEINSIDFELKEVEKGLARVVPEYLDAKRNLEWHVDYQKEVSEVAEALSLARAKVTKLRRESSALSNLLGLVNDSSNDEQTDIQSLAEDLECVSPRFSGKETKDMLLLILARGNKENNEEAMII